MTEQVRITIPPSRYTVRLVLTGDPGLRTLVAVCHEGFDDYCPPELPTIVFEPWPPPT